MADFEKLATLKKVYSEIILNTAKEATTRVMASERKAKRYRRELSTTKDEALRMLLHLKTMLDSKDNYFALRIPCAVNDGGRILRQFKPLCDCRTKELVDQLFLFR